MTLVSPVPEEASKVVEIPADWADDPLACHELYEMLRRVSLHRVTPGAATTPSAA